ncbi:MAG: DUF6056 family protein [Flavobacteriales bacterium]
MPKNILYHFVHSKNATLLAAGILLSGLIVFAMNNRISIDDMFFYARCRDAGIREMVLEQYNQYSGRFTAYFLNGTVLFYFNHTALAIWNVVSIVCFFLSVRFFIKSCPYLPNPKGAGWIFLFAGLLFGCTHPGEQFFWYTQVNTYLWSATCALVVLAILYTTEIRLHHVFLVLISCIFVGGSSESFLIQLLLLVTALSVFSWKKFTTDKRILAIASTCTLITIGYFTIFSPGNQVRSQLISELNHTGFFKAMAQSVYSYFSSSNALISYAWLLPLLMALSFYLREPLKQLSLPKATVLYFTFLLVFMAPSAWALREPAPARALITCDLLTMFYLLIVLQKIHLLKKLPVPLGYFTGIITVLAAIIIYSSQCITYAKAYDKRDNQLRQNNTAETLKSNLLPDCRMYKAAHVYNDKNFHTRWHIHLYYSPGSGTNK